MYTDGIISMAFADFTKVKAANANDIMPSVYPVFIFSKAFFDEHLFRKCLVLRH